ncbi:hypothetical protein PUMCH_001512 [Australozyma saopauloensis]|uniref:RING-type domain-containing protein n=1 Tax=Australozyma saopauloensis TaxID=291208 RepID=A0AAX4H6U5_9ASCO|nr:hypothetical protein PUMCH_001512 [[Candida] saopauloensis]
MAENGDVDVKLNWLLVVIDTFGEAVNAQSQYAESRGISWDRFGSMAAYVFSSYGIATFLVAVLLNRTMLLAAATNPDGRAAVVNNGLITLIRKRPRSQALVLGMLRLLALYVLAMRAYSIFVALSVVALNEKPGAVCQLTRWVGQYMHYDPQAWADDKFMRMPRNEVRFGPTSSMLWPIFTGVSYSLFVESFSSAILNTKPFLEGGISLFELSLAIQEMSSGFFFLREFSIAKRPLEQVLIVCLFLICDQFCNQIGSLVFKNQYRLISLTALNLCFIWYYVSNVLAGKLFMFPINISVTYLTLIFVLVTSLVCLAILALAIITKGFDLAALNFTNYFAEDHREREFFTQHLGIRLSQDFHLAVLNLGIFAVTLAGKSSYSTEYSFVPLPQQTWIEASLFTKMKMIIKSMNSAQIKKLGAEELEALFKCEPQQGYGKIIAKPTSRALSSIGLVRNNKSSSTTKIRAKYLTEIFLRGFQVCKYWFASLFVLVKRTLGFKNVEAPWPPAFLLNDFHSERMSAEYSQAIREDSEKPTGYLTSLDDDELSDLDYTGDMTDDEDLSQAESDSEDEITLNMTVLNEDDEQEEDDNNYQSAFSELLSADDYVELIENQEMVSQHWRYLKEHDGIMTRSRYHRAPNVSTANAGNSGDLLSLINSIRNKEAESKRELISEESEDVSGDASRLLCVICQYNPREIITWPCKCFAICEECRIRLASNSMEGCVCCRRDVEGVSRIYIP